MVLDPNQIQVDRPISLLEEQAAERVYEEEKEKVTFGQAVDAAFAEENTMSWIFNGLEDHEPDREFDLTPELIEQYTEGVPEDRKDYVVDAVSLPHLQKLHDRAKESLKNQDTLAKYGWGGVGLQIAAATLDVPAIAATIATEGIAAPLIWGGKATRLARTFRAATASSASAAAIEAYLVSQNNMKDPYDILYAAGGGFLLGGAVAGAKGIFGKASKERYQQAAMNTMKYADEAQAADVNQAMIDRGIDTGFPKLKTDEFVPFSVKDDVDPDEAPLETISADEMISKQGQVGTSWFISPDGKFVDAGNDHLELLNRLKISDGLTIEELAKEATQGKGLIRSQGLYETKEGKLAFGIEIVQGQPITKQQIRNIRKILKNADEVYADISKKYSGEVIQSLDKSGLVDYLRTTKTSTPVSEELKSVGAAENPASRPMQEMDIRRGIQERIDDADAEPMAAMGKIRFDMVGQLKSSTLGISRRIAGILGEDAVEPGEITADLIKTVGTKVTSNKFYQGYEAGYDGWAKSSGVTWGGRKLESRRGEFGKLVSDEIESPGTSTDPNVIAAAQNTSRLFRDMLQEAKRAGVKGFDDIPEDLTYFTHLWDGHRLLKAEADFGTKGVQQLLKQSLLSANRTMDDDLAEAIAKGMFNKIVKNEVGMDAGLARIFSTSNKEALRDILLEEELLDEVRVDRLLSQLDMDREGVPARAKRRLKFDMSSTVEANGKTLHIKELMERDTEAVVNSYINSMQGKIALAKKGIFSDGDFEAIKKDILEEGKKLGGEGRRQADKDIEKLNVLYALVSGRTSPLIGDPSSNANRMIRLLMDYNFIRVMNQVGFAQISELGNAVAIDGTVALMRVVPDMGAMIRRTADGELEDLVARDVEAFVGSGVDRVIQQSMNKYSVEDMYGLGKGDRIDRAIGGMHKLKRLTADLSGLAPITVALERAAAKVAVQSLVDVASGVKKLRMKKLGKSTIEQDIAARLKSFGLDEKMWPRVVDQIQKNAVTNPSMFLRSRKVKSINMSEWKDIEARDAFGYAVARWTRQSIQQNDVGNLNIHMTSTMGKIFTQFRAFMLVSHAKQFLHNIKRNDFAAYQAMMWSTFYGALAYTAQTHVNAIGRDDKAEFLKERLSAEEIGKMAFARSSWAALFPSAADMLAWSTGYEPMFSYKRSTGLATGFFSGAPIINQLDTMGKVMQGGARSLLNPDYQWSRGQQRAFNSLLPFQNAIGIKNILNQMVDGLPEQAKIE